jgi:hypothetical protein
VKVFLSLIPLALVVACASPAPQPQIVVQTKLLAPSISPELFDCGDAPRAPAQAIMQSAVARYIVVLWAWGSECQSHLLAVKQSLSVANPTWLNTSKER